MEKSPVSLDRVSEIFEMLLKIDISEKEYTLNTVCDQDETIVSSIDYSGVMNGTLYMLLHNSNIDFVYRLILERFDARYAPEHDVVFFEFLNIFAGHLVTEYGKNGVQFNITPPGKRKALPEDGEWHIVTLTPDTGVTFKFIFVKDNDK